MNTESWVWAVIGDLVGSRRLPSRPAGQAALGHVLSDANGLFEAVQELDATVGDEFQGVYASLPAALNATCAIRLLLPEPMDARFGIGHGVVRTVGSSRYGEVQDGPAWWAARDAIVDVKAREAKLTGVRTLVHDEQDPTGAGYVNAYLLCRDQLVSSASARQRRLAAGLLLGATQADLAKSEQISASAVSQAIRSSGLGVVLASMSQVRP